MIAKDFEKVNIPVAMQCDFPFNSIVLLKLVSTYLQANNEEAISCSTLKITTNKICKNKQTCRSSKISELFFIIASRISTNCHKSVCFIEPFHIKHNTTCWKSILVLVPLLLLNCSNIVLVTNLRSNGLLLNIFLLKNEADIKTFLTVLNKTILCFVVVFHFISDQN